MKFKKLVPHLKNFTRNKKIALGRPISRAANRTPFKNGHGNIGKEFFRDALGRFQLRLRNIAHAVFHGEVHWLIWFLNFLNNFQGFNYFSWRRRLIAVNSAVEFYVLSCSRHVNRALQSGRTQLNAPRKPKPRIKENNKFAFLQTTEPPIAKPDTQVQYVDFYFIKNSKFKTNESV